MAFVFSSGFWPAILLVNSILSFVVAFGLLLGERWAWKLTIVVDIFYIALAIGLFALHNVINHFGFVFVFVFLGPVYYWLLGWWFSIIHQFTPLTPIIMGSLSLFTVILRHTLVILYLMLPHVKAFFLGTGSPIHEPERTE